MLWATNYSRLASQTVFTLFFGGKTFAPKCYLDGVHIQDYLQSHFIRAFGVLADRIRDVGGLLDEVVIGWDSMNEPSEGFIGREDLSVNPATQGSALKKGSMPTPLQSLKLGMGIAQTLDTYTFGQFGSMRSGSVTVDPKGVRIWADPSTEPNGVHPQWRWKRSSEWTLGTCVWALHDVWDPATGELLKPAYFRCTPDPDPIPVEFLNDFLLPHLTDYVTRIRDAHPSAIAFVQAPVFAVPPEIPESLLKGRGCHSTHYYDGLTLVTRHWNMINADAVGIIRGKYSNPIFAARFGERAIRASIQSQLGLLKSDGVQLGSDAPEPHRYPTMVGEIGTPMDFDDKKTYDPTRKGYGDYSNQERALDASLNATDGPNVLNYTIWTYCPDNSHMWGDGWNNEDLSLWSDDDVRGMGSLASARTSRTSLATLPVPSSPYVTTASSYAVKPAELHELLRFLRDGARAVRAFCRPYPVRVIGTPVDVQFDIGRATLKVKVRVTPGDAPQLETESAAELDKEDGDEESALPTEIFVPLVHFASDVCVERSVGLREHEQRIDSDESDRLEAQSRGASTVTLPLTMSTSFGSEKGEIKTEGYAVQVKVSEGRVELDESEQMLRWFYAVPVSGDKEVSIEVKRVGGAIDWARVTRGASSAQSRKRCVEQWVEKLCGRCFEGCSIM